MTDPVAIQAPVDDSAAVELARGAQVFRKTVLKVGKINYKGRVLDFTPAYLDQLAAAHDEHVFPTVPLMFPGADNAHTQAVDAIRGEILGFERNGDKLDALIRATNAAAAETLRENPNICCSVRIETPIDRADGKHWPAAIQHVLATANPKMPGLGPWQPVDLSSDDKPVLDLTNLDFAAVELAAPNPAAVPAPPVDPEGPDPKEPPMADDTAPAISAEELAQLRALLATLNDIDADDAPEGPGDDDIAAAAAAIAAEEQEKVSLSNDDPRAIELTHQLNAQAIELAALKHEREGERFEAERNRFADAGIPPYITELARPLLQGTNVVDLSNGTGRVDAGQVVRDVLTAVAKHAKLIDLSSGNAVFTPDADETAKAAETARTEQANTYAKQLGLI